MSMRHSYILSFMMLIASSGIATKTSAQSHDTEHLLKYGDMNSWVVRHIHESAVIGGQTKTLYEIGPNSTIEGNKAYTNKGGSPWGTSNVMAKVMGVVKTN